MHKLLLILLILSPVFGQNKFFDETPDIQVTDLSYRNPVYSQFDTRAPFSIDVKNVGAKVIKAVYWDFILIDSVHQNSIYDRLSFVTADKQIKPGEKKRLTKRIDYHVMPDYIRASAKITRVDFVDGSTWKRGD